MWTKNIQKHVLICFVDVFMLYYADDKHIKTGDLLIVHTAALPLQQLFVGLRAQDNNISKILLTQIIKREVETDNKRFWYCMLLNCHCFLWDRKHRPSLCFPLNYKVINKKDKEIPPISTNLGITKVQDHSSRWYLSKEMLFLASKFPLNNIF